MKVYCLYGRALNGCKQYGDLVFVGITRDPSVQRFVDRSAKAGYTAYPYDDGVLIEFYL